MADFSEYEGSRTAAAVPMVSYGSSPRLDVIAVSWEAVDQKPRARPARLHGLPQQAQADGDGYDAALSDVLIDELAVARAAGALLAQELPRRKMNVPGDRKRNVKETARTEVTSSRRGKTGGQLSHLDASIRLRMYIQTSLVLLRGPTRFCDCFLPYRYMYGRTPHDN